MKFSLPAPAKINRFLHIIGRRQDGYHLLQTLYQFIDLQDSLTFEPRKDDRIVVHFVGEKNTTLPTEKNLVYLTAKRLHDQFKLTQGVTITLEKKIPMGAGLGGGSSNAATTIVGLNQLWRLDLSVCEQMKIGASLGADVCIFLWGESAWGEGIGEQLTAVTLDEPWIALLHPACTVSTQEMFGIPELTRNSLAFKIGALSSDEKKMIARSGKNDFEPVVCRRFTEVDKAMKWLSNFGKPQLSGSGASVFSCFSDEQSAREVIQQLPPGLAGQVAKAINFSPLKREVLFPVCF